MNKKKRARQIKQVSFFVNDKLVKKSKKPDKGDTFALPVADNLDADLRAVVTLFPSRHGHKGKRFEASASYLPCTG